MTRAFYRSYRSVKVTRVHILRDDNSRPLRATHRAHDNLPARPQAECGTSAGQHCGSEPIILDPMPLAPPDGLTWCPLCLGRLAERAGLLGELGERLAAIGGAQ